MGKIVFWFNPLVYVYNNRLLLVHEYQADKTSATQPQKYGQFLIEQAMLHTAPSLSHSFNRSPIKKRIIMLTKRSSTLASGKKIIAVPLIALFAILFTNYAYSGPKDNEKQVKGNITTFRGNKFEKEMLNDTTTVVDPVDGKEFKVVTTREKLIKMNGEKIYQENPENSNADNPTIKYGEGKLEKYLTDKIRNEINKLGDGTYKIDVFDIVVDAKGKVVYYENNGLIRDVNLGLDVITYDDPADKDKEEKLVKDGVYKKAVYLKKIDPSLRKIIEDKVNDAMKNAPVLKPLIVNGEKVPYLLSVEVSFGTFKVNQSPSVIGGGF